MIRARHRFLRLAHVVLDALLLLVTFAAVHAAVDGFRRSWLGLEPLWPLAAYGKVAAVAVAVWLVALRVSGAYHSYRTPERRTLAATLLRCGVAVAAILGGLLFAVKDHGVSRVLVFGFVGGATVVLAAERIAIRLTLEALRRRAYDRRRLLLVGPGPSSRDFLEVLGGRPELGFQVVGCLASADGAPPPGAGPRLGAPPDLEEVLARLSVDEVAFFLNDLPSDDLDHWLSVCAREGVRSRLFFLPAGVGRVESYVESIDGIPSIAFGLSPSRDWQLAVKRAIDVAVSLSAGVLLAPLVLAVAFAVRLSSPGPVLFRQQRYGLNKRRFTLIKFRTMVDGAEHRLDELRARNEMDGPVFKMRDDPRVTRLGRVLRATSIDELPQLWNVLVGDMSLVGPRPPTPSEVDQYEPWQRRRLSMKPGLTGPWQVNGRSDVGFERWMRLDMDYVDNWSLGRDLEILLKTVPAILRRDGAW